MKKGSRMPITGKQIAMARILLDLSQKDLADKLSITRKTIMRVENNQSPGSTRTMDKIQTYFENNGLEFTKREGVQRSAKALTILSGHQGFSDFLDDVYQTAILDGTPHKPAEVYLSNVHHQNWIDWMGPKKWKKHTDRMTKQKEIMDVRIIVKENDYNFPANAYSQYKWFPENIFNEKSFYSYGNKLAFLDFKEDDLQITIMQHKEFSEGYRALFKIAWNHFAKKPKHQDV